MGVTFPLKQVTPSCHNSLDSYTLHILSTKDTHTHTHARTHAHTHACVTVIAMISTVGVTFPLKQVTPSCHNSLDSYTLHILSTKDTHTHTHARTHTRTHTHTHTHTHACVTVIAMISTVGVTFPLKQVTSSCHNSLDSYTLHILSTKDTHTHTHTHIGVLKYTHQLHRWPWVS